ncbi:MAG: hypothetical protein ACT6S0_03755 [Roseateles sp.]|uniref:hypothetical protein n=1 Tax=Roseateles sp. TaxID=1971397 RepID=UPI004036C7B6
MSSLVLVGEDDLCCALGEQLIEQTLPGWTLAIAPINKRGVTKLKADLTRYMQQALHVQPVLCVADTDGACPVTVRQEWLLQPVPQLFLLRLAVKESEAWAMADRSAFASALGVSVASVPRDPETLPDAKREVLRLAARSTKRRVKEEMLSLQDVSKPGTGYNKHLCAFVRQGWRAAVAREASASLNRAILALEQLRAA